MSILRSLTGTDQRSGRGKLVLAAAALVAAVGSAQAGTTNAYAVVPAPGASAPVLSLQNIVTYADTVPDPKTGLTNQPQAGFVVGNFGANPAYLLQQVSGNSINRLTVTIAFSVIGSDGLLNTGEQLKFRDPSVYLAGLPSECGNLTNDTTAANPKTITCVFRQTKPGFTFPAFAVFFDAPVKSGAGGDRIDAKISLLYSEQTNGGDQSPVNSSQEVAQAGVALLGTSFPTDVKTAVSKNGVNVLTGDGGVPKGGNPHTEIADVPKLPDANGTLATAQILITKAADNPVDNSNCIGAGNFTSCPIYQTTIVKPFTTDEIAFDAGDPLVLIFRIDATALKRSASQILNNTLIKYTGGVFTDELVGACTNGAPNANGLPCVLSKQCYKSNIQSDLAGDCEWITINKKNGLTKFF